MPIRPENRARYPADWKAIRAAILERAGHRCEKCGVENYSLTPKGAKVVLTIAHLDHTPENCDHTNLRAWCQRCHLSYDAEHHRATAIATRKARATPCPPPASRHPSAA